MKAMLYPLTEITPLTALEAVRKRPSMYIGSTGDTGIYNMLWEIINTAIDEATEGFADTIHVSIATDGKTVTIEDNGRGISVDENPFSKKSVLETLLTELHCPGSVHSDGTYGVGLSVVNALSESFIICTYRDSCKYTQQYIRGIPTGPLMCSTKSKEHADEENPYSIEIRQKVLNDLKERVRAKLAERAAKVEKTKTTPTPPRYDEVYVEGIRWLAGEPIIPSEGDLVLSDDKAWPTPDDVFPFVPTSGTSISFCPDSTIFGPDFAFDQVSILKFLEAKLSSNRNLQVYCNSPTLNQNEIFLKKIS